MIRHLPTILCLAVALILMIGLALPRNLGSIGRLARSLAKRKRLAVLAAGLFGFGIPASMAIWRDHAPNIHDEHSILLAADTFAHGRLTNPTPPCAENFDSFHTLVRPTYQSKYPPLPGIMFALGQGVAGDFIVGAWISLGMLAAAGCWMFQAFVPARWALLGGLMLASHPSILFVVTYNWSQAYWAAGATAAAGALVYGAVGRIRRGGSPRHFLILGIGLLMLANSRPFEGLLVSLPAAALMGAWIFCQFHSAGVGSTILQLTPLLIVLGLGIAAMLAYFQRVTGNPLRMPYLEHEAQYAVAPTFYPLPVRPVPKGYFQADGSINPDMTHRYEFHASGYELASYHLYDSVDGQLRETGKRMLRIGGYFFLPFTPMFIGLLWLRRSWKTWFLAAACLCVLAGSLFVVWTFPHYLAPFTAATVLLVVQGLRVLIVVRPLGRDVSRVFLVSVLVTWLTTTGWLWVTLEKRSGPDEFEFRRQRIARQVSAEGGKHLILVRYAPNHNLGAELVYNGADFAETPVLWARSLGPEKDQCLRAAFSDRTFWLLEHAPGKWNLERMAVGE